MKYFEVNFRIEAPEELLQDVKDVVSALAGEAGFESFDETPQGLVGYVQQEFFSEEVLRSELALLPFPQAGIDFDIKVAEDKDWNEQWEQVGFEPIIIKNKVVVHDGRHTGPADKQLLRIEIDAHQAFGTGTHETTRLMIGHLLELDLNGKRVLDCGTGTGILAIASLLLGAADAVGYDIDEWSVDNARHNAVINRVDGRFCSLLGNAQKVIPTLLPSRFDVVMANINRNILLADMSLFAKSLKPGGTLLLSGFYREDLPLIEKKAEELLLMPMSETCEGDWQSCRLTAPA